MTAPAGAVKLIRDTPFSSAHRIRAPRVIVQPDGPRVKKLLVADMDSTMIGQECIDELADYAGMKPQIAAITERLAAVLGVVLQPSPNGEQTSRPRSSASAEGRSDLRI